VNERVVTVEEFERDLQKQMDRLQQRLGNVEQGPEIEQRLAMIRDQMKRQLVEQTITRLLLEDYIARSDVTATEEEVDEEWNRIAAQFPDAETFEKVLEEEGVTVAEVREQVSSQVKLDKLMAQEVGESEVTDAEAQAFYDLRPEEFAQPAQVRARHILLPSKERAEELHKRIEEGEDFAALAGEFSECPSGKQGGDLGFFGEGQMVEPFSRQAFAMKAGEVSAPIETEFGYHIIKVEEHREAKQAEFAEVQEAIKQHLGEERAHAKQDEFIERLKKAATITVNVALPSPPSPFPEPDEQLR
jgi:parvulin-like peptidyl-prolyl isomerase